MSDDAPLPTATPPAPSSPPDDQAARIDQLLTAGLDECLRRPLRRRGAGVDASSSSRSRQRPRAGLHRTGAQRHWPKRQRVARPPRLPPLTCIAAGATRPTGRDRPIADAGVLVVSARWRRGWRRRNRHPMPFRRSRRRGPTATQRAKVAHALLVAAAGVLLFVAGAHRRRARPDLRVRQRRRPPRPAANARASGSPCTTRGRPSTPAATTTRARPARIRRRSAGPGRRAGGADPAHVADRLPMLAPDAPVGGRLAMKCPKCQYRLRWPRGAAIAVRPVPAATTEKLTPAETDMPFDAAPDAPETIYRPEPSARAQARAAIQKRAASRSPSRILRPPCSRRPASTIARRCRRPPAAVGAPRADSPRARAAAAAAFAPASVPEPAVPAESRRSARPPTTVVDRRCRY